MPYTKEYLDTVPISFYGKDEVWVTVGPCSQRAWKKEKIPLDGRQYHCGGTLILKNGQKVRASFTIKTTDFDFLIRDSVYIPIDGTWYRWDEPELLEVLGLTREIAFPFYWQTDVPLDYGQKEPYPMRWPDNRDWDKK
jgi:hypothetical protein